ncbi:unnamed protein product [Orchesella dallaii]|uniref:Transmembrane protein n=1 Tax=Orchesella dallaii TaxID=48710 RepID=A0ABP1S3A7_9HEXA
MIPMLSMSSAYLKSGSKWSCSSGVTMLLLVSYLLISTVITSFVASQPVTNLPSRNKLTTTMHEASSSSFTSTTVEKTAAVTSSRRGQLPHLSSPTFLPTPRLNPLRETKQDEIETLREAKVEGITKRSEHPSQESEKNPNTDDDLLLMTKRSKNEEKTSPIPNFSLVLKAKIKNENETGGEVGGEQGKEIPRDKNKVMVTDDVKISSGGNLNPSTFSTQNADQSKENGNLWHTPSHFHEDGEDDFDEGNDRDEESPKVSSSRSSPITKIHIPVEVEGNNNKVNNAAGNLNKSHRIMSTLQENMTDADIIQEQHRNANVVNNHANLLQEAPQKVDIDEKSNTTSKSHHTSNKNNSGNNAVTSREHDNDEEEVDANGNDNNAESADEQQDDENSDSSRGNLEFGLVTKMDNVSFSSSLSSFSLQSESSLVSPVDKNKGDKGQGREEEGEHHSDYYYDSASTDNDTTHPPSPVSSSLLMNKWIKSLVKLSQCRANCLDQAGGGGFSVDSEVDTKSPPSTSFWRGKKTSHLTDYNHDQVGGAKRAPQTPVSSTLNRRELPEKSRMLLGSLQKKSVSNNPHPILPLGTIPRRTIKATTSSPMKYYELSACQESCKRKFPLAKQPNFAEARDGKSINETQEHKHSNEYAIRNPKPMMLVTEGVESKPSQSDSDTIGNNSNGNNSSNNNSQRKGLPVEMEKADRKSNNNRHQQHHYMPPQKGLVEQHHDENQLSSNLPRQQELQQEARKKPIHQQQQLPDGQNKVEDETKRNESSSNSLMKLLAIEQATKGTGSANNFKTFPTEPRLKVRQVEGIRKSSGAEFPLHFLQLSWPQPSGGRTIGNNNNRPEGESAQVKDKKGIDDDDEDEDEKNEKEEGSQRPRRGGGIQPITVYSIILEESWESDVKPDGTRDTYARRWKLIDQTVERTTTQISLPTILPTEQKGTGKEESGQVTAGAFVQKKEIKGKERRKNSQRMMMIPPSLSSFSAATDPPSKVTLRVLAVTSKGGLEKVYSAELNNSYYHFYLDEHHHHQHDHPQEHPNPSIHRHQQVYRENHKGIAVKEADRSGSNDNPTDLNFSNKKTGNQSVVVSGLDKKKEKVRKKVENKSTSAISTGVNSDGNNENSNQILAFPSKESQIGKGRGIIRSGGSEKVKKLLTMSSRQQNRKSKGENEANTYSTGQDDHTTFSFSGEKNMALSSTEKGQNWGLHTVSMVYQKFLVVTQVTWDFPGDVDFNKEVEISNNIAFTQDRLSYKNDEDDGRKMYKRSSENEIADGSTNSTNFTMTLRGNSKKVHDFHEIQSEKKRREMDDAGSRKEHKGCGGGPKDEKGREDSKLNFLLSWEIFGGGLRGNLVTDTCSASISLWPDTVYIIQVGLITSSDNVSISKSTSDPASSPFHQQSQSKSLSPFIANSFHNESKSNATHPPTHFSVDDRDIDNDEMSNSGSKLGRDIDGSLSKGTRSKSSTISVENGSGKQEQNNLVGNDISKASLDPLILPESITFPFDGGEPKVTIKSERIVVNTTRVTNTGGSTIDKIPLGNTQSNNNFHNVKDQRPKNPAAFGNSDQVLVSPITIRHNGDGQNEHSTAINVPPTSGTQATKQEVDEEEANSVWDDDDDEATDQDESLFARYHSHHHHPNEHHPSPVSSKDRNPISLGEAQRSQPEAEFDQNQKNRKGSMKTASLSLLSSSSPSSSSSSNGMRYPNFFPVNSFYQSLYALSQNALQVSSRYPSVITINGGLSNKSSSSTANLAPLVLSEFSNSNRSSYLFGNPNGGSSSDNNSALGGKLYTLFVVLVISFVIFLFIVAIVGFCVLTSSIKENYKYFVPKKVRVWTTVGQLLKGSQSSSSGGGGGNGKDSGEGSFYPRRLHEDPDYEFDDNDDFDPDEDDEEEVTSVADTDEEDDCDCNSDDGRGGPSNTFSLNERSPNILCSPLLAPPPPSSSDTSNLIRIGETEEIRVTLEAPHQHQENGAGESRGGSCNGNCDNNNPYYHTMPGNTTLLTTVGSSSSSATPQSCASTGIASSQENFYLTPSSPSHNHSQHSNHQRKKSDVRIDVSSSNSNARKAVSHQRQQGYY